MQRLFALGGNSEFRLRRECDIMCLLPCGFGHGCQVKRDADCAIGFVVDGDYRQRYSAADVVLAKGNAAWCCDGVLCDVRGARA